MRYPQVVKTALGGFYHVSPGCVIATGYARNLQNPFGWSGSGKGLSCCNTMGCLCHLEDEDDLPLQRPTAEETAGYWGTMNEIAAEAFLCEQNDW